MFYSLNEKRFGINNGKTEFLIENVDGVVRIKITRLDGKLCAWGMAVDENARFGDDGCISTAAATACGIIFGVSKKAMFMRYGIDAAKMPNCDHSDIKAIENEIKAFFR